MPILHRSASLVAAFALTTATSAVGSAQTLEHPAPSAPADGDAAPAPAASERPPWSHRNQLSLRIAGAEGYRIGVRYGNGEACDASGAVFCHGRAPVLADLALGFGVSDSVEIEGRFRVGEPEWHAAIPLAAGLGVRLLGNPRSRVKFVFGVAVLADFTGVGSAVGERYGTDVLVRLEQGLHYDVARAFGFYFQFGETIGVLRALALTVDAGFGIQIRVP
jgi:hypothetical protein